MEEENKDQNERVIETASATTSHDNQNSGSFAYVVTALAVGGIIILSLALSGMASFALSALAESGGASRDPNSSRFDYDLRDDSLNDFDFEDFLKEYGDSGDSYDDFSTTHDDSQSSRDGDSSTDVAEVLDFSIAPYDSTIGDKVSASAYAGTPDEVRDFVRNLVNTDADYTKQLVGLLDTAATKDDQRTNKIKEATDLCADARKAIDALEVIQVKGDKDGEVSELLLQAKGKASDRWKHLEDEMALLNTSDKVNTNRLWNIDDRVLEATDDAADGIEDAMYEAARL